MVDFDLKRLLFMPFGIIVVIIRHLTSWYITPIWAFCLPYFIVGASFMTSLLIASVMSGVSYKIWKDYNTDLDGQISLKEIRKTVNDDLT